jgi:signal transduction histidine kinase
MRKILIIEDERSLRMGVSEILTFEGFKVIEADNGETGIAEAIRELPDLILCDVMMPLMDGFEVLEQLRKNENTRLIPFIFMTALADRSDQRAGMELGCDDYITKPYTRNELLGAVKSRLNKATLIREKTESSLNELRDKIIQHLPHELRTPLNGILGYGQLLMDYPQTINTEELADIGKNIYNSALRLNRLIHNYLIYTILEIKKKELLQKPEIKNLKQIIDKKVTDIAVGYNRCEDLRFSTSAGVAYIGEEEFTKVVEEITDNAFKFSMPGTPIWVSCGMDNECFFLKVQDKGRGIAPGDIPRIGAYMQFDRKFYEQQGSGFGLIISKKITELYNGTLTIESIQGEGTTIYVKLPGK